MPERLSARQARFTCNVALLIQEATRLGYALTFGEVWRPNGCKSAYYAEGKSHTKTSRHTQRLAVDFNVFFDGAYITEGTAYAGLGAYWKSLDSKNRWGGDFPTLRDYNHFEMTL